TRFSTLRVYVRASALGIAEPGGSALAHIGGFAAAQEVLARRRGENDHFPVFAEPSLVPPPSPDEPHHPRGADPLFGAETKFHLPFEHPYDLLICVTVRLNMDASSDAPPDEHPLITGENPAADLFADLFLR